MAKHQASEWRTLIGEVVSAVWSELEDGPQWIEAQVHAESLGDPDAVSYCGAQGLLQLMPATAADMGVSNPFDPRENLWGGVSYLKNQFLRIEDIPDDIQRLLWALTAYNCGLGYVWRALHTAYEDRNLPGAESWWDWNLNWRYLGHRKADYRGKWAEYHQSVPYVGRIRSYARQIGARVS